MAGGIVAPSFEEARRVVEGIRTELVGTKGEQVKMLGECCSCSGEREKAPPLVNGKWKGKGKSTTTLAVHLSVTGLPSLCFGGSSRRRLPDSTTLIIYTPLVRARLQFLSISPLPLDLNSFSTGNVERKIPVEDGVDDDKLLSDKVKSSGELDFSKPLDGTRGDVVDLDQVVDWVSLLSLRLGFIPSSF